jgi:hypothetical protein
MTLKKKNEQVEELRRINALVTPAFLKRLDDWRRHQTDLPSVSEAIRRLIEIGIDNSHKPVGKKRD